MDDSTHQDELISQGTLELRAERAVVEKQRARAGSVTVRRERRTRQQTLTVELVSEVLVLETRPGSAGVIVDGTPLALGETREVTIYQEEARVEKRVVVAEQVQVFKRERVQRHTLPVELAYEELDISHSEGLAVQQSTSPERGST